MHKLSERGVIHLLIPILLLLGIIGGVYLITSGNPLKLFSKAANPPIVFKSNTGAALPFNSSGVPQSTSSTVKIELTSTLGSPLDVGSTAPVSGPVKVGTVSYRITENLTDFNNLGVGYTAYSQEPTVLTYTFKDSSPGQKFLWVEFKDSTGKTDRRSAQLEIVGSSVSSPIPPPTSGKPSPCPPDGDVNDDKFITNADAELVLQIVAGSLVPTTQQRNRVDVDGDGRVTSVDALIIQKYAAGEISTFPACK